MCTGTVIASPAAMVIAKRNSFQVEAGTAVQGTRASLLSKGAHLLSGDA
jgi:hypothetical protein